MPYSTMATIHDLPNEIICDIFSFTYDTEPDLKTPIGLSGVCKWWRDVAESLQALWTDLRISSYDAEVLYEVFQRSKGAHLDIEITFREDTPKGATLGLWKSIILLAAEMGRCRRLSITAPGSVFKLIRDVFGSQGVDAPLLWSLDLKRIGGPGANAATRDSECAFPIIDVDRDVLEHVSLDGVAFETPSGDFGGVKALYIKNLHAHWLRECLPAENELEVLYLANSTVAWGRFFSCPELQHLILEKQDSVSLLDAYWDTPVLTHLTLVRPTANFWDALMFLLVINGQPLGFARVKKLTLVGCDSKVMIGAIDVGRFIMALPAVEVMEFIGTSTEPILAASTAHPAALPNLKEIIVNGLQQTELGRSASS